MSKSTDGQVIAASRTEPERFGLIFERHHAAIYAYLRRRLRAEEARELAAETFTVALRVRAQFDVDRESARPWLFGIATNLLRHHRRRERRRLRAYGRTGLDPIAYETEAVEDRADAERAAPTLARALASLPGGERDVLLLSAWGELAPTEIAEALAIPAGTVHSRLSRARTRMREAISAIGQEQGEDPMQGDPHERGRV